MLEERRDADERDGTTQDSGRAAAFAEVVEEIESRDRRDAERSDSPLACDDSYTVIDTSELSADEVVDRMAAAVRAIV